MMTGLMVAAAACSSAPGPAPSSTAEAPASALSSVTSIAAIGDSISQGVNACQAAKACPEASWATGSLSDVNSLARRFGAATGKAPQVFNDAHSGARVGQLAEQIATAVGQHPQLITIMVGSNDICTSTLRAMTSEVDYRTQIQQIVTGLRSALPQSYLYLASVPDIPGLKSALDTDPAAAATWRSANICQSVLKTSTPGQDSARLATAGSRIDAYNAALASVCAATARCIYDQGAVHAQTFTAADVASVDYFHPSVTGQQLLAAAAWTTIRKFETNCGQKRTPSC